MKTIRATCIEIVEEIQDIEIVVPNRCSQEQIKQRLEQAWIEGTYRPMHPQQVDITEREFENIEVQP
jgi:predicted metal-dependent hydrolase